MDKRQPTVFVVEGGKAFKRDIQTSFSASDMVEVVQGLKPEDTIIIRGGFQLKDGDKIAIIKKQGP